MVLRDADFCRGGFIVCAGGGISLQPGALFTLAALGKTGKTLEDLYSYGIPFWNRDPHLHEGKAVCTVTAKNEAPGVLAKCI